MTLGLPVVNSNFKKLRVRRSAQNRYTARENAVVGRELDFHVIGLGKLLANLISLETILRSFLENRFREANGITGQTYNLDKLSEGDSVPIDPFTDYRQLIDLIKDYNSTVVSEDPSLVVDESVVEIRHAIAHGRALSDIEALPLTLYKFGSPDKKSGTVKVTHCVRLTEEWFNNSVTLVRSQIEKVAEAIKLFAAKRGSDAV